MQELDNLRQTIDKLDTELIELLAKRQQIAINIGQLKAQHGIAVYDEEREKWLHDYHTSVCRKYNISPELIANIFEVIIDWSRKLQQNDDCQS
jgi:chorismate mutase